MDGLKGLQVFCAVAELESFTAAAMRLSLSPAMASKHVHRLEERLGARLLNRTSRSVSLTEAGRQYFNHVRALLDALDDAEAAVTNVAHAPRGKLRLTAPVWFANDSFARTLADYHALYPDVCVELDLSGRMVNLVEEAFDLALRATSPDRLDPGLVARPLARTPFHLMASPAYLAAHGVPSELSALNGHALLHYSGYSMTGGAVPIQGPNGRQTVRFHPVMESDNETMLHLAAREGVGLVFLPIWLAERDLIEGRLKIVLADSVHFEAEVHAVYPSRKYLSAKVRTFVDFLVARFASLSRRQSASGVPCFGPPTPG